MFNIGFINDALSKLGSQISSYEQDTQLEILYYVNVTWVLCVLLV